MLNGDTLSTTSEVMTGRCWIFIYLFIFFGSEILLVDIADVNLAKELVSC